MARESIIFSVAFLVLGTAALVTACFVHPQQQHQHRHRSTSRASRSISSKRRSFRNDDDDDHDDDHSQQHSSGIVLEVTGLQRFAVKGLSPDQLEKVELTGSTFPDDRRYALWQTTTKESWKEDTWMHKQNFVCAFTHPQVLAQFRTSYSKEDDCSLTLRDRATGRLRLGPISLATETGRRRLASFVTQETGVSVQCVIGAQGHFHFGNTSSATKQPIGGGKARCMHLVLQSTVDALADKIGEPLNASRFRPNIILQPTTARGVQLAPFQELGWVGKTLQSTSSSLELEIISKTVRCAGVGVDPLDLDRDGMDIPALLIKHFPEHGPYLGVYCILKLPGTLARGDFLQLVE